jgi:hypothetical protein
LHAYSVIDVEAIRGLFISGVRYLPFYVSIFPFRELIFGVKLQQWLCEKKQQQKKFEIWVENYGNWKM